MAVIFNIDEAVRNSAFNILQEPFKMKMTKELEAFEKKSILPYLYVMQTMDTFQEEYRSKTSMDGFKPTEDMEVAGLSDFEESYRMVMRVQTWTNSFAVSKQTIEDNQLQQINPQAMGFVTSYYRTRENYGVRMLGAALGEDYAPYKIKASVQGLGNDTADGTVEGTRVAYFKKDHKTVGGKYTQSNKFKTSAALTVDGSDPEEESKLADLIGQIDSIMSTYKGDKGEIIPTDIDTIIIAEDFRLKDTLQRALKSRYNERMGGNGENLFYGKYELVVCPYLNQLDAFSETKKGILLVSRSKNRECLGAVWKDRTPLEIRSYIDNGTQANIWAGRSRFGVTFGDFRAMAYLALNNTSDTNSTELTAKATGVKLVKQIS